VIKVGGLLARVAGNPGHTLDHIYLCVPTSEKRGCSPPTRPVLDGCGGCFDGQLTADDWGFAVGSVRALPDDFKTLLRAMNLPPPTSNSALTVESDNPAAQGRAER